MSGKKIKKKKEESDSDNEKVKKIEKKNKKLHKIEKYEGFLELQKVDERDIYNSWSDFVEKEGFKSKCTDGSPIVHWIWRTPIMERLDDEGYTKKEAKKMIEKNPDLEKDTLFLYYFQMEYESNNLSLVCLKIFVDKEDEGEIRRFIEENYIKPFE